MPNENGKWHFVQRGRKTKDSGRIEIRFFLPVTILPIYFSAV
jgi:hypothetical protein